MNAWPGLFDRAAAVLFGRIPVAEDPVRQDHLAGLLRELAPADVPVIVDLPFGHTQPTVTVPLGAAGEVRTDELTITALPDAC